MAHQKGTERMALVLSGLLLGALIIIAIIRKPRQTDAPSTPNPETRRVLEEVERQKRNWDANKHKLREDVNKTIENLKQTDPKAINNFIKAVQEEAKAATEKPEK